MNTLERDFFLSKKLFMKSSQTTKCLAKRSEVALSGEHLIRKQTTSEKNRKHVLFCDVNKGLYNNGFVRAPKTVIALKRLQLQMQGGGVIEHKNVQFKNVFYINLHVLHGVIKKHKIHNRIHFVVVLQGFCKQLVQRLPTLH